MGQTRMFRDRVVSMEQTLEGGEKHLPLLKEICQEAFPDLEYREHALDHERDLFVMDFGAPDGSRRRIAWTRMVLFDAERIPTLTADPASALRERIVRHLRTLAGRPEIVVTFRHLEEGWVDTPEPRREGGRRRRRGGRGGARGAEKPPIGGRPGAGGPAQRERRPGDRRPGERQGGSAPGSRSPASVRPAPRPSQGGPPRPAGESQGPEGAEGKRRRRFRRRRRGRGPGGGTPGAAPPSPAGPKG